MAQKNCNLVWQNTSEPELTKSVKLRTSEQAGLISEVLQRSSDLESETIVIKLPACVIEDAALLQGAVDNIAMLKMTGANIIVVHDHTNLVNETLELFGIDKKIHSSLTITDHKTSQIVEMVLSGHINKKIVSQICATGCQAIGISGKDGDLIEAKKQGKRKHTGEGVLEFGFIGEPATINPEILMSLADSGFITVISPVAFGQGGETYLLDADITSSIVASVTAARHLVLLTEMESELAEPGEYLFSELKKIFAVASPSDEAKRYLEATLSALENTTENVHLIDARLKDAILLSIFSDEGGIRVTLE